MWKSDGSDRKIERWLFLWCCYNNAGGELFACYEKGKGHKKGCNKDSYIGNSRWFFVK